MLIFLNKVLYVPVVYYANKCFVIGSNENTLSKEII